MVIGNLSALTERQACGKNVVLYFGDDMEAYQVEVMTIVEYDRETTIVVDTRPPSFFVKPYEVYSEFHSYGERYKRFATLSEAILHHIFLVKRYEEDVAIYNSEEDPVDRISVFPASYGLVEEPSHRPCEF
ncbi:MAG: hypothetical protein JGK39_09205 [Microcoleus sp. PH2017_12_PCY_D_A]|uniref:hypothetical protein n=2 Tax=unclassified Microcoleus TaxID=2642155 RepID=UPI001DF3D5FA|nr:hypothetical protein [Microcoleus sp. PH2017_12_PCY_D_A]MCC3478236.1 hypothetical protein [Microcoleus sp. PH2017_12_PCY_D_A]